MIVGLPGASVTNLFTLANCYLMPPDKASRNWIPSPQRLRVAAIIIEKTTRLESPGATTVAAGHRDEGAVMTMVTMDDDNKPVWERQAGESEPAYAAFLAFRDLGPGRTVAEVGRKLGKSGNLVDRWCQRWAWRTRTGRWDTEVNRRLRAELADQRKQATAVALTAADVVIDRAMLLLTPPKGADPETWVPETRVLSAASGALGRGLALQRLALDMPTSVTRQEAIMREELQHAQELFDTVGDILVDYLCDNCRPVIFEQLRLANNADRSARA